MFIKSNGEFKKFDGFIKKLADTFEIITNNCTIKCSHDHKFKKFDGTFIEARNLKIGDIIVNNKYTSSEIFEIIDIGKHIVYSPLNVDGFEYDTDNGLINHNCSFIGSSPTLISGEILEKLVMKEPIKVLFDDLSLSIYEMPIPGAMYVMGCDCASGTGGDYACTQVLRIKSRTEMYQVATYRSNTVSLGEYSRVIDYMSKMYNDAYYILENNDVGATVANELWYTLQNSNLINTEKAGKGLGTKADKKSKLNACMELKRLMDAKFLTICDGTTISEISRFEEQVNQPNVFKAAKGNHDDTVSALYWAVYCTLQPEIDLDSLKYIELKKEENDMTIDMMADAMNSDNFWSDFK